MKGLRWLVLAVVLSGCAEGPGQPAEQAGKKVNDHPGAGRVAGRARKEKYPRGLGPVVMSPDGRYFVTVTARGAMALWDFRTGEILKQFGLPAPPDPLTGKPTPRPEIYGLAYSPDSKRILVGMTDNLLVLCDPKAGKVIRQFAGHQDWVYSVAFSPDGRWGLSGSRDKTVRLWDLAREKEIRTLKGHTDEVYQVAFTPDGRSALSASADHTIRVWDLRTGKERHTLRGPKANMSFGLSPDGMQVLSVGDDKTVRVWDLASAKLARRIQVPADSSSVAFLPDGKRALVTEGLPVLWDMRTGKVLQALKGVQTLADSLNTRARGAILMQGGKEALFAFDKILVLWDLQTDQEVRRFKPYWVP